MYLKLSDFGYQYYLKSEKNPPEASYVCDTPDDCILWGMCFEESRKLGDIVVNLEEDMEVFDWYVRLEYYVPEIGYINTKNFTWHNGHYEAYPIYPEMVDKKTFIYHAHSIQTTKIRFRMVMSCPPERIPPMSVAVYGTEPYETYNVCVESGLWGCKKPENEIFSIYNGMILNREEVEENGRRYTKLELAVTNRKTVPGYRPNPDRTIVTVSGENGPVPNFNAVSFLPLDLEKHDYIQIPDFGILVYKNNTELPENIREQVHFTGKKVRDAVNKLPQRTFDSAQKEIGMRPVPQTEETKNFKIYSSESEIEIPDKRLQEQWKIGLSHLMAFCNQEENGRWNVRIGPYKMFGTETSPILRMLTCYGYANITITALETFLDSASKRTPDGAFYSKEGCLCIDYGIYPGDSWIGLDPAYILISLTDYYALTRDGAWLEQVADKILACVDWFYSEIEHYGKKGAWDEGLMPPARNCDIAQWYSAYHLNAAYYMALQACERTFTSHGGNYAEEIRKRAPKLKQFKENILRAYRKSLSLAPVVPLRDGTFAPCLVSCAYGRGLLPDIFPVGPDNPLRNACIDVDFTLRIIEAGIFGKRDIEAKWILDSFEDYIALDDYLLPKKWDNIGLDAKTRARDATWQMTDYDPEKDWYAWGGTGWQNGYCPLAQCYLILGDVNCFLRTLYNSYMLHVDPETYWFREHAATVAYPPKTHEEAMFLYRLRGMFLFEHQNTLYMNRCVPDDWFQQGFRLKNMLTEYGVFDMEVTPSAEKIVFHITRKLTENPEKIILRVCGASGVNMVNGVYVNGVRCEFYNPEKNEVLLNCDGTEWNVEVRKGSGKENDYRE